jgi:hypothetical protein
MNEHDTQEIRAVLSSIMRTSRAELRRYQDAIAIWKDEDPAIIAQLSINVVECSAAWNTAFLIASRLKIRLDEQQSVEVPTVAPKEHEEKR